MSQELLPFFDPDANENGNKFDFNEWARLTHSRFLAPEEMDRVDMLLKSKEHIKGLSTGFEKIDFSTKGLQGGNLIVIGGRPSMGKTAFAISIVENIIFEHKANVAYFSLEESRQQTMSRMLGLRARIDEDNLRDGFLSSKDWSCLTQVVTEFKEANIFIDDTSPMFIQEIQEKATWLKHHHDIQLVVIDYLQLLHNLIQADNSPKSIEKVVRTLKCMAIDLNCPVILLSQLSRNVGYREVVTPTLRDLPGAGAIASSADIVMLLLREEYYAPTKENRGAAEVIIAKNNYGPLGSVDLSFVREYMRFEELKSAK